MIVEGDFFKTISYRHGFVNFALRFVYAILKRNGEKT